MSHAQKYSWLRIMCLRWASETARYEYWWNHYQHLDWLCKMADRGKRPSST